MSCLGGRGSIFDFHSLFGVLPSKRVQVTMQLRLVLVGLLLLRWNSVGFRSILFRPRMRVSLPATRISTESAGKDKAWLEAKGRTLVIVESPAKAKTIQKFLNEDEYIVDFCLGHVRDLPSAAREVGPEYRKKMVLDAIKLNVADLGVDVQNGFEPLYVPMAGKSEVLKRLIKLSKECSRILLATDEDREGEAISWHLLEVLKPKVPYKRAVFHEITKGAILDSFENPREIDMNLVQSQETRRILDRLAGYTISPVLWRYVATGLSAGRVQSCGLYLITQVRVCLCVCSSCVLSCVVCCVLCAVCCVLWGVVCVCASVRRVCCVLCAVCCVLCVVCCVLCVVCCVSVRLCVVCAVCCGVCVCICIPLIL